DRADALSQAKAAFDKARLGGGLLNHLAEEGHLRRGRRSQTSFRLTYCYRDLGFWNRETPRRWRQLALISDDAWGAYWAAIADGDDWPTWDALLGLLSDTQTRHRRTVRRGGLLRRGAGVQSARAADRRDLPMVEPRGCAAQPSTAVGDMG